jgi:Fe-S cluster assembly protein SufD
MRTKAEQALLKSFEAAAPALPGGGWVARLRHDAMAVFGERGLPHRRIEEWKYTDLRERLKEAPAPAASSRQAAGREAVEAALGALAGLDCDRIVMLDGRLARELSRLPALSDGIELLSLADMLAKAPAWLEGKFAPERIGRDDAIAALNLAFMTDGVMLRVKAGARPARPVMLVFARTGGAPALTAHRNILAVEGGAALTLIEARVALAGAAAGSHANVATDLDIGSGADVRHILAIGDGRDATHLAQWRVRLGGRASYRGFQLTAGAATARNEMHVGFTGPDAKLDLSGVMLGRGRDHIDTTLVVDHTTTGCESRELFKTVLTDQARAVFQGKVIVRQSAQKTDGKQMAQALMLSEDAEFDSKPELAGTARRRPRSIRACCSTSGRAASRRTRPAPC